LSEQAISYSTDFHDLLCGGLYTALIFLTGYAVLCTAFKAGVRHWLEIPGFSFAAGAGVVSLVLFFASLAGAKPSRLILFCVGIAAVTLLIFNWRKKGGLLQPSVPAPRRKFDALALLSMVSVSVLLLAVCNVSARAGWPPLYNIDSFAIWMFKAKWVFIQPLRPIPPEFHDLILSYSHQDYPLSFPFLVAGLCTAVGRFDERLIKILFLPIYLSLIAVMYSVIRRIHRRATALIIAAIFATAPTLAQNAGFAVAETPLILAYTCALAMLLRWMEAGENGCLPLAGLFATMAAFTKNEGLALLPVLCVAALIGAVASQNHQRFKQAFAAACVCGVAIGPWLVFRAQLPKTHEDYGGKLTSVSTVLHNLPRLKYVLGEFLGRCFNLRSAGLIWVVLIVVAGVGWRGFGRRTVWVLWSILAVQLMFYVGTFVVTPWKLEELVPMISGKLLAQASPVAALLIGMHLRSTRWPVVGDSEN